MQRKGITRFEKWKSSEMATTNLKWKAVKGSTWVCAGLLSRGLNADL
jgi:hypothetical protein